MTGKKKTVKKVENPLSVADDYYIRNNAGSKTFEEVCNDIGRNDAVVKKLYEDSTKEKAKKKKDKFDYPATGSVVMTQEQSAQDDKIAKRPRNTRFMETRLKNAIHVIDKDKPIM